MRLKNPVANVDDVNVLLNDDVAGEHAVVNPVTEPPLGGRSVWPRRAIDVSAKVIGVAASNFAKRAGVNAAHHFHERRAVPDLEADVEAELAFSALANLDDFFRAGHVDGYGLFKIHVLAGSNDRFEVLRMKIRRCGNDNSVDSLGNGNFVKCVRADEELRAVNRAVAFGLLEFVKVGVSSVELVLKQIRKRHNARAAGVDQICSVFRAPPAAAEQADANRGVRVRAANQFRLNEHQAGRGGGYANEFAAVEFVGGVRLLVCFF